MREVDPKEDKNSAVGRNDQSHEQPKDEIFIVQ